VIRARQTERPTLRWGYWMQFWAALYAVHTVYPQPRLTVFTLAVVVVLAALIYDTAPATWRRSR